MMRKRERFCAFLANLKVEHQFTGFEMALIQDIAWKAFNEGYRRDDSN